MTSQWQPYREPLRSTILRTGTIAIVVGAVIASPGGGWRHWPILTLFVFWPSFGGHWVEVGFLNWLRPRLPIARGVQIAARVGVWFAGGVGLAAGMRLTAASLGAFRRTHWPAWWLGGVIFIGIELMAHLALQLRGRPGFYNGRG